MEDLTPRDFTIIASKNKVVTDEENDALGSTIGGLGTTPVSDIEDVIDEDGNVDAEKIAGTIPPANLDIANRGWGQTSVFSATDADTVSWGAGTFTAVDGTAYSIDAGNTGNMVAKTYIYLDTAVSTTAYQTTTTSSTAVGAGKVLIATAQNGTSEATFFVLGGQGGLQITGVDLENLSIGTDQITALAVTAGKIAANTITASQIAANTITASEIATDAITADEILANTITANELSTSITYAGSIIIDSAGLIRSGQTAYDTGTGWWIGNDGGTPKFSFGNSAGNKITWSGTVLTIVGDLPKKEVFSSDGTWTKPTGAKFVRVISIGAGGGGGSGAKHATTPRGGTGGGGGAYQEAQFDADDLGATEAVTVGVGGAGGVAVTASSTAGNNGANGGSSSFGNWIRAGGGGGGIGGLSGSNSKGGAGGGITSAATSTAGTPQGTVDITAIDIQGANNGTGLTGVSATFGGACGAGNLDSDAYNNSGGSSIYGGAGGGTGGAGATEAAGKGGAGGRNGSYTVGGGGTGGQTAGAVGTAGDAYSVNDLGYGGEGGGGGAMGVGASGGAGGVGGIYGGAGGGGGKTETGTASGAGGDGGNGVVIVFTW